jgi:hypothetical protein
MAVEKASKGSGAASPKAGKRGRPANPNSALQKQIKSKEPKRPRGRPIDPNSERQRLLASLPDEPRPRGRPINPNSRRQQLLDGKEARKKKRPSNASYSSGRPINPNSARQRLLARRDKAVERAIQAVKKKGSAASK